MQSTPHTPREPSREPRRTDAGHRTWHLTFGTYAARLHHDPRPTVDRRHNTPGTPFPPPDPKRQQAPTAPILLLTREQCIHIETVVPALCERGGWTFRTCAAAPNHVHTLLDAPPLPCRPLRSGSIRAFFCCHKTYTATTVHKM